MILFDWTHPDPWANIAMDEAVLETAESASLAGHPHPSILRFWEPDQLMVVLGRSSPFSTEVNHDFCETHGIPVIRRCSGGQSIVTGPGCLMYAVLLDYQSYPELRSLDLAHEFVMQKMLAALRLADVNAQMQGTCDLTLGGKKFSGNSLRCKRSWFIYHGTMICDLDVAAIANCLGTPVRQPGYRADRSHSDFLTQLPISTAHLKQSITQVWNAQRDHYRYPDLLTSELVAKKYRTKKWTQKVN